LVVQYNTQRSTPGFMAINLRTCLVLWLLCLCSTLWADEGESGSKSPDRWKVKEWKVQTSLYTKHWSDNPDHVNDQNLINVEMVYNNDWLAGGAYFDNSFGQSSWFLYMGHQWPLFHSKYWYFKLMGGLLYGYKDEYKDKIPLNGNEIAPAILPSIGLRYKHVFTELNIAGTAAITVTAGISF
jgi:hypothetical protein